MTFNFVNLKVISFPFGFIIIVTISFSCSIHAALFEILNNCNYTVWAAANPGGGRELRQGQTWYVNTDPNFKDTGRIWARTNCNFDTNSSGKCDSGDCDGNLYCVTSGSPPVTLAEYSFENMDFFDVSLVDGFNVPMEFKGASSGCTKQIKCTGDVNELCPTELRHPGGCNHPCTVFQNDQFCCRGGNSTPSSCGPTAYSRFFKGFCPSAYSYAYDDATSTFTCPSGSNYTVVFCP
ncbi:Thaumatin-like protein [Melia azedarach]|uniref:Thaumatin-like protein n=1 Tax=Melia azedarach TaxID=155640 RepID=A0ACC1X0M9_MELAZ|nr:Thaumatin-like protein [Melia azedarach]